MDAYIPSLIVSLMIVVYVWSVVLAKGDRGPIAAAYNLFSGVTLGWLTLEILLNIGVLSGLEPVVGKIFPLFWLSLGFVFLNFAHVVAERPRRILWWLVLLATVTAAVITVATDEVITSYTRYRWGVLTMTNHRAHILVCLPGVFGGAAGLILLFLRWRRVEGKLKKGAIGSLIVGGVPTLVAISVFNIVLPDVFGMVEQPPYGSSALALFVLLVYRAVMRFRFMGMSVEQIVEDLFHDTVDGVILVGEDGAIRRLNGAAARMLEVDAAGWEGMNVGEVLPGAWDHGAAETKEVSVGEGEARRTLSLSISSSRISGMEMISVLILKDVSAEIGAQEFLRDSRNRLEREVRARTQEFRRAQRMEAMGILGAGIAHDFNNLLAAVMGFASAARDDLPATHPIREDLEEVLQATRRGRDIVRQMLSFSQTSESKATIVNVSRMTREALKLLEPSRPPGVRLELATEGEGFDVEIDSTGLHQVLVNLVKNAYQAMEATGGTLHVTVSSSDLDGNPEGGHGEIAPGRFVGIRVEDQGPGMDEETLSRIFDPFFTTKSEGEGTGLGLVMVEGIVSKFGGTVVARSEPGRGSEFTVYLPMVTSRAKVEEERPETVEGGVERILLVDDKDQITRVGRRMLEQLGYQVTAFVDPRDALADFGAGPLKYDIVITDLSMPHMSGIDLSRQIRDIDPSIPIILLSGNLTERDRRAAREVGIQSTLFKPLSKSSLAEVVRQALDGRGKKP